MKQITALSILAGLSASALLAGMAQAQAPGGGAQAPVVCKPASAVVAPPAPPAPGAAPRPAPAPAAPRDLTIKPIDGVVAGGGAWRKVWQQGGNSADGILPGPNGSVLVAQEDYDSVLRIEPDGRSSVFIAGAKGIGSMSMDRKGRLFALSRTERPGSTKADKDSITNSYMQLTPASARKLITDKWDDGTPLTVRPNDIAADGTGNAFLTQGCLYYATPKGVSVVAEDLRTNGLVFSPNDKVLYVTNGPTVVAFDVKSPGKVSNRREFAKLEAGGGGDGMAMDTQGRLYVTSGPGVQVFDKTGKYLGLIPTPRGVIAMSFGGADKKNLYVVGGGADDASGKPIRVGPQATAATVYELPVLSQGVQGRAK